MDERTLGFVELIDHAIEIAESRRALPGDPAPRGALENFIRALQYYRNAALTNLLERSEGFVTTGLLREVGDWGEPPGSDLLRAAQAIERYYLDKMQ